MEAHTGNNPPSAMALLVPAMEPLSGPATSGLDKPPKAPANPQFKAIHDAPPLSGAVFK